MASNDGQRLTVFGLGYREQDTRKMNRILDHYERLPPNGNDRAALFANLTILARDIPPEEAQSIENWLANGGDFPFARPTREQSPSYARHRQGHQGFGGPQGGFNNGANWGEEDDDEFDSEDDEGVGGMDDGAGQHVAHNQPPHRAVPRHQPQPRARVYDRHFHQGFGAAHAPLPHPPFPLPPMLGAHGLPNRRGAVGGFAQPALDPFLGHGGMMPMPMGHHPTAFDMVGPGRRLGEEGEEEPLVQYTPNPELARQNLHTPNGEQPDEDNDGQDEDDEDYEKGSDYEMDEEEDDFSNQPQVPSSPAEPAPPLPTFECEVCCETKPSSNFPPSKITAVCEHDSKVCYDCLEQVISVQVQEGVLGQLNCPLCPAKLSFEDIQAYASPDVFQRYKYLVSRAQKNFFMCLNPICGAGQIHNGGKEQPLMICNACGFQICTHHGRPWHAGQTCKEFDCDPSQIERLEEEEATAKLLAEDSRICPNCNEGVSKVFGCDHMACRCGKAWCFICEADWENIIRLGGAAHALTCIYNPAHVRKRPDQIAAERSRALEAVHGGQISDELRQAKEHHQETRRATMRPLALEAAEKRMKEMKEAKKEDQKTVKKRKVLLKPAWEEGGHAKKAFGG